MCTNVAGSLLNFHEGVRTQAASRISYAWMPVYDDKLAPKRDSSGFNGHTARQVRLEHEALSYVSSRTRKLELELGTQCSCTGEGRFCTH